MLRWCLLLSAYNYRLRYRPGNQNQNADALSRLPLPISEDEPAGPGDVLMIEAAFIPPLTPSAIADATARDPEQSQVTHGLQTGNFREWSCKELRPFLSRKTELSTHKGCILWGSRVIIPPKLQADAFSLLHAGHKGMTAMKHAARSYFWWPGLDSAIEDTVRSCDTCQMHARLPASYPAPAWSRATDPSQVIHMDLAGPIQGQSYLVVVDSTTKWLEVRAVSNVASATVIDALRSIFATLGLPQLVVSDNATTFVSDEMKSFFHRNGIRQVTSAPYHPSTNGQPERMVQELKRTLKKQQQGSIQCRLSRFLFSQHTSVHSTTNNTSAEMFGRNMRTLMDSLVHDSRKIQSQEQEKPAGDSNIVQHGQAVWLRDYSSGPQKWCKGTIYRKVGLRSYEGITQEGKVFRRHVGHLRPAINVPLASASPQLAETCKFPTTTEDSVHEPPVTPGTPDHGVRRLGGETAHRSKRRRATRDCHVGGEKKGSC
ncbi:uncharacterized protein K02A2.6-like [Ornithodoros turicata]|uniref:uncharacterized protein K02A2.6-like n=1 Tax=Ornithodoros turicata TaxID=34597 RepID=UPI003139B441